MFGRLLDSRRNSIAITTLTFRLSNQYRVGTLCFFVFFPITLGMMLIMVSVMFVSKKKDKGGDFDESVDSSGLYP